MKREVSVADARDLCTAFQSLHGQMRPVKNNQQGAVILVPFDLHVAARLQMNKNIAALTGIVSAHDKAMMARRDQINTELEDREKAINEETQDEDERAKRLQAAERELQVKMNKEASAAADLKSEVDLDPIKREQINEGKNAFDPMALARLTNAGLLE